MGPAGRKSDAGGKTRARRNRGAIFRGSHVAIPLTVAYSAIFVTNGQEQHGESDEDPDGEGRQVRLPPADRTCPRPINVVMPAEEFERGYDR